MTALAAGLSTVGPIALVLIALAALYTPKVWQTIRMIVVYVLAMFGMVVEEVWATNYIKGDNAALLLAEMVVLGVVSACFACMGVVMVINAVVRDDSDS